MDQFVAIFVPRILFCSSLTYGWKASLCALNKSGGLVKGLDNGQEDLLSYWWHMERRLFMDSEGYLVDLNLWPHWDTTSCNPVEVQRAILQLCSLLGTQAIGPEYHSNRSCKIVETVSLWVHRDTGRCQIIQRPKSSLNPCLQMLLHGWCKHTGCRAFTSASSPAVYL